MATMDWFDSGLKFECTQCGNCCGGAPGTVLLSEEELLRLAESLGLSSEEFGKRYTRRIPSGKLSLLEKPNHDCVFFERGQGCTVYSERPTQCRTWPFWRANLASRAHWEDSARECPGMDQGPLHRAEDIRSHSAQDGTSGFIPKLPGR